MIDAPLASWTVGIPAALFCPDAFAAAGVASLRALTCSAIPGVGWPANIRAAIGIFPADLGGATALLFGSSFAETRYCEATPEHTREDLLQRLTASGGLRELASQLIKSSAIHNLLLTVHIGHHQQHICKECPPYHVCSRKCLSPGAGPSLIAIEQDFSSWFRIRNRTGSFDDFVVATNVIRDIQQLAPLYQRHLKPKLDYCSWRPGRGEVAEASTSLIFERVLRALPGFRGGVFRTWLFTIGDTVITDSHRSIRRHETIDVIADEQRLLVLLWITDEKREAQDT